MNVYELLGLDRETPTRRNARDLVRADRKLVADLIRLRTEAGLTQSDVARLMGVSASAVCKFESGERDPHLSTIRRYAIAVGASIRHDVSSIRSRPAALPPEIRRGREWMPVAQSPIPIRVAP